MAKRFKQNNKSGKVIPTIHNNSANVMSQCDNCHANCPCANCPKRILIVGGIERMEPLYRQLIEEQGLIFEYHAGHLRKGGNKLENCVQRADMILCPVNCNSHSACLQVKQLCKKHKKNLQIMKNFSLSAIGRTLDEHSSLNAQ